MALPRLSEFGPVILLFRSENGIPRLCETCIAATHWPRFLNPEQACCGVVPFGNSFCRLEESFEFGFDSCFGVLPCDCVWLPDCLPWLDVPILPWLELPILECPIPPPIPEGGPPACLPPPAPRIGRL